MAGRQPDESHDRLQEHLKTFLDADNFAKRLKTLKGLTAFELISEKWTSKPERFPKTPDRLSTGLNIAQSQNFLGRSDDVPSDTPRRWQRSESQFLKNKQVPTRAQVS